MGINKQKYFNYVQDVFVKNDCELLTTFDSFVDNKETNLSFRCKCGNIEANINFKWYHRSVYKACKKCVIQNNPRKIKEFENIIHFSKIIIVFY
jgi:hypothetical protein